MRMREWLSLLLMFSALVGIVESLFDKRWPCNKEHECYHNTECPVGHYRILVEMPGDGGRSHCVCSCVRDVFFMAERRLASMNRNRRARKGRHLQ